jgi:hypothetical protein
MGKRQHPRVPVSAESKQPARRKPRKNVLTDEQIAKVLAIMTNAHIINPDTIKRSRRVIKRPLADVGRIMNNLRDRGSIRMTTARDSKTGAFTSSPVPIPGIGSVLPVTITKALLAAINKIIQKKKLPFVSGLENGSGLKSQSLEIKIPDATGRGTHIVYPAVYDLLRPYFPAVKKLLAGVHAQAGTQPAITDEPNRVFFTIYQAGILSGLDKHVDAYTSRGAVTIVLTLNDGEGPFFTTTADPTDETREAPIKLWPLTQGMAVAILPGMWHGVTGCTRSTSRIAINLFY